MRWPEQLNQGRGDGRCHGGTRNNSRPVGNQFVNHFAGPVQFRQKLLVILLHLQDLLRMLGQLVMVPALTIVEIFKLPFKPLHYPPPLVAFQGGGEGGWGTVVALKNTTPAAWKRD